VMAEITLSHLLRLATELGCPVSRKQALAFLNQEGRAFEIWKQMMQADEDFIKCSLLRQCISPKRTQPIGFSVSNTTDGRSRRQFVEIKARCPKLSSGGFFQLLAPSSDRCSQTKAKQPAMQCPHSDKARIEAR
jgi:hypothetical protein